MKFILSILIAVSLLLGCHLFLYFTLQFFLKISEPRISAFLFYLFIVLTLIFPLSMMMNHFFYNPITKWGYVFSSFWIGLAINLILAFAVTWICWAVCLVGVKAFEFSRVIFFVSILSAVGFSFFGLWQAMHPRITKIEVKFKNLPSFWQAKTFVQLSDLHLGIINGPWFFSRVVSQVNSLDPEFVVITGDLFDGSSQNLVRFIEPLRTLKVRRGVFFVTGNHEGYLGFEEPLAVIGKTDIKILDNEIINIDGLQIVGASYPEYQTSKKNRNLFDNNYEPKKPSVLLFHTPTNIKESHENLKTQQMNTYFSPDTDFSEAKNRGIDLQLSGHTHGGQIFPFNFLARLFYHGYEYGLHEMDGFHLYVSSGTGTWGPPLRTWGRSEIVVVKML